MKQHEVWGTVAAILLVGAALPGCLPGAIPDKRRGSLCAQSQNGGPHCVRANIDPSTAWEAAMADGGLPIEMWAEWPGSVGIGPLARSEHDLRAWFADLDTALTYVRDTKRSAESYKASMEGHVGKLIDDVGDIQGALLAFSPVDPAGHFKTVLLDKAGAEKGPLVAMIADDKQSMAAAQATFDQAKSNALPLASAFATVAAQFTTYRATEAAETQAYVTLAKQASQSTLITLPDVEQAILTAAQSASAAPNALALAAMKLSAEIQAFESASQNALYDHADFLAAHGAARPDFSSRALRSLNAMLGYIQQRVARSDATAASLLRGTATREQALLMLDDGSSSPKWEGPSSPKYLTPASRDKVAQSLLIKAGAVFIGTASARVAAIDDPPPTSKTLKLPYLARRYDQLTVLLQLEPLCDPASSSWREAGCVFLRERFDAAKITRASELPALIKAGIAKMRDEEADALLLDAAQARLDAKDTKGAALLHDAALRGTEAP